MNEEFIEAMRLVVAAAKIVQPFYPPQHKHKELRLFNAIQKITEFTDAAEQALLEGKKP